MDDLQLLMELMPPPPPRPPAKKVRTNPTPPESIDDSESESASMLEESVRTAETARIRSLSHKSLSSRSTSSAQRSATSGKRRRKRRRGDSGSGSGRRSGRSESQSATEVGDASAGFSLPLSSYANASAEQTARSVAPTTAGAGAQYELTDSQQRFGVFRDTISSGQRGGASSSTGDDGPIAQAAGLRASMARAQIPAQMANRVLEQSIDEHSMVRRHAVPLESLYAPGTCVVCEETLSFVHKRVTDEESVRAESSGLDSVALRKKLDRAKAAQMSVARENAKKHELVFRLSEQLATRIPDKRLVRHVLTLRRNLIENDFELYGIEYVAWTEDMLVKHFDPINGHRWDAAREALADHRRLHNEIPRMMRCMYAPSVTNPGSYLLDPKVADVVLKFTMAAQKTRENVVKLQRDIDPNSTATLRALTDAIEATNTDQAAHSLTMDPEFAAGTLTMGGDEMRTAGSGSRNTPGSAHQTHYVNGL